MILQGIVESDDPPAIVWIHDSVLRVSGAPEQEESSQGFPGMSISPEAEVAALDGTAAGICTIGPGHGGSCLFVIERPGGMAVDTAKCCVVSTYGWPGEIEAKSFDIQKTWGEIQLVTDGLSEGIDVFTGGRAVIAV